MLSLSPRPVKMGLTMFLTPRANQYGENHTGMLCPVEDHTMSYVAAAV